MAAAMTCHRRCGSPSPAALAARQKHGTALLVSANQLEEQVGSQPVDLQVADLVNDQKPRCSVYLQLLIELAFRHVPG